MTWDALSPAECKIIEDAAKEAEVEERNVVLYNAMTASSPAKRKSVEALLSAVVVSVQDGGSAVLSLGYGNSRTHDTLMRMMSRPVHAMLQVPRIPQDVFEEE